MVAYHGSNSNFKKLRIDKRLVKHQSSLTNEGLGIYFSTDIDVAKSYGRFIYKLNINDNYIIDFRKVRECRKYVNNIIKHIMNKTGVDISQFININELINSVVNAVIPISGICREIYLLLDSNEYWYGLSNTKITQVYSILSTYDKKNLKVYMFPYNIKNIGICKTVDEDVVQIINKYKQQT